MSNITQPVFSSLQTNNYKYYDCWISIGGPPPNYGINKLKYDIGHNLSEENKDCVFIGLNEKSVLISLDSSFYHFVAETVSFIAEIYEKDKNTLFIINSGNVNSIDSLSVKFVKSFIDILDNKNIRYLITDLYRNRIIVKNVKIYQHNFYNKNFANRVYDFFYNCIKDKDKLPSKMVYVSRRGSNRTDKIQKDTVSYNNNMYFNHDERIDDEPKLEKYFKSIGFDVIDPTEFASLEDQINYFYDVKTLVSLTGSGLTNAIFMQKNQKVIELVTSMVTLQMRDGDSGTNKDIFEESIHNFFINLSFDKEHYHYSISNIDRKCDILIDKIEQIKDLVVG